jgi:hypothetical protein
VHCEKSAFAREIVSLSSTFIPTSFADYGFFDVRGLTVVNQGVRMGRCKAHLHRQGTDLRNLRTVKYPRTRTGNHCRNNTRWCSNSLGIQCNSRNRCSPGIHSRNNTNSPTRSNKLRP